MTSATFKNIDGKQVTVKIGDVVGFKCDIEQHGRITKIERANYGHFNLTLENRNGFDGGYIGGQTTTVVRSDDTWEA